MVKRLILILAIVLGSLLTAKEMVIAFTGDIPPYIQDNAQTGLEVEIVREALAVKGHEFNTVQYPYKVLETAVEKMGVDAAAGVREKEDSTYYSDFFIDFQNAAITKTGKNLTIKRIADLKGKTIVIWQNAWRDLGVEFERFFAPTNKENYMNLYQEIGDQKQQVELFWQNKADVIIIDVTIFRWLTKQVADKYDVSEKLTYHELFSQKTSFQLNFKDEEMRDDFNEGLRTIKENGKYQEIFDKYLR